MFVIVASFGLLTITLASPTRANYSDEFARTKMLPLAAAAYSGKPQECLENRFSNATLSLQLSTICGPFGNNDVCSGFTAVIHSSKAIVLSFRGTTTFVQLSAEGELSILHEKVPWIMGGAVSSYFRDAFMTLWTKGMGADFKNLTAVYPEYDVWVTGHSLGAALATFAASYVVAADNVPSSKVFVVTFGQPRVGDYRFARAYEEKMGYSFRVTHWRDWVPHVLSEKFFNYYHHSPEAFYLLNMTIGANYTVCEATESQRCSDGQFFDSSSVLDHLVYFDVLVTDYGKYGCNTTMDSANNQ